MNCQVKRYIFYSQLILSIIQHYSGNYNRSHLQKGLRNLIHSQQIQSVLFVIRVIREQFCDRFVGPAITRINKYEIPIIQRIHVCSVRFLCV